MHHSERQEDFRVTHNSRSSFPYASYPTNFYVRSRGCDALEVSMDEWNGSKAAFYSLQNFFSKTGKDKNPDKCSNWAYTNTTAEFIHFSKRTQWKTFQVGKKAKNVFHNFLNWLNSFILSNIIWTKKGEKKGGKIVHTIVLFELIKGKKFRPKKGRVERITKKNTDYQPSFCSLNSFTLLHIKLTGLKLTTNQN